MKRIYLKIPEGRRVHPRFVELASKVVFYMTSLFVNSYHKAEVNIETNTRRGKLPMQINKN
jgi:hypothetical protein